MSNTTTVTNSDWQTEVLEADTPVLVDFWAVWCGPCKVLDPIVDEVGKSLGKKLKVVKVNVDEEPELSQRFTVMSIPTLMVFKDGQVAATKVGSLPRSKLYAHELNAVVSPATDIRPLEKFLVPAELDGSRGLYRRPQAHCLLKATNDYLAILAWLRSKQGLTQEQKARLKARRRQRDTGVGTHGGSGRDAGAGQRGQQHRPVVVEVGELRCRRDRDLRRHASDPRRRRSTWASVPPGR